MNDGVIALIVVVIAVILSSKNAKNRSAKKKKASGMPRPAQPEAQEPVPVQPAARDTAESVRVLSREPISPRQQTPGTSMENTSAEGLSLYPDGNVTAAETVISVEPDDNEPLFGPEDIVNGLIMSEILNRKTR